MSSGVPGKVLAEVFGDFSAEVFPPIPAAAPSHSSVSSLFDVGSPGISFFLVLQGLLICVISATLHPT